MASDKITQDDLHKIVSNLVAKNGIDYFSLFGTRADTVRGWIDRTVEIPSWVKYYSDASNGV